MNLITRNKDNLGVLALGFKAGIGFILNLVIWKKFNSNDFITWSILYYLGIFTSLSDFGIGQYLVKENYYKLNIQQIKNSLALICIIVTSLFLTTYLTAVFCFHEYLFFIVAITGILLFRILFVPFSAVIVAKSDFYLKKIIEAVALLIGGILLFIFYYIGKKVETLILAYNLGVTLTTIGSIIIVTKKYEISNKLLSAKIQWDKLKGILIKSFNFFKNNLSNAFVYSLLIPFISIFDIPLRDKFIAYFTFLFVIIYQITELYFRHRQKEILLNKINNIRFLALTLFLIIIMVIGLQVFNIVSFSINQFWVYLFLLILYVELIILKRTIFLQFSEGGDIILGKTIFIRLGWFIFIYLIKVENLAYFSLLISLQSLSVLFYLNKPRWTLF